MTRQQTWFYAISPAGLTAWVDDGTATARGPLWLGDECQQGFVAAPTPKAARHAVERIRAGYRAAWESACRAKGRTPNAGCCR